MLDLVLILPASLGAHVVGSWTGYACQHSIVVASSALGLREDDSQSTLASTQVIM